MFSDKEIQFSKDCIKTIYDLKKSMDYWASNSLQDLWNGKFQPSFMQFLLLIDSEGKTNKELANMSRVSKQAMSKIIFQLAEMDLIKSIPSIHDKRSSKIFLTPKGQHIVSESLERFTTLISEYKKNIDHQEFEISQHTLDIAKTFIQNHNK